MCGCAFYRCDKSKVEISLFIIVGQRKKRSYILVTNKIVYMREASTERHFALLRME